MEEAEDAQIQMHIDGWKLWTKNGYVHVKVMEIPLANMHSIQMQDVQVSHLLFAVKTLPRSIKFPQ